MSIGLDAAGEFAVKSAERALGIADWAWQLAGMADELRPHVPPTSDNATPFDLALNRDAIIVFRLEPGAWAFEADPSKALFLKSRADGSAWPHNPFSAASSTGNPREFAVRIHAAPSLAGCAYDYNLGVVVKQGGKRTPLVIDPKITNGVGN